MDQQTTTEPTKPKKTDPKPSEPDWTKPVELELIQPYQLDPATGGQSFVCGNKYTAQDFWSGIIERMVMMPSGQAILTVRVGGTGQSGSAAKFKPGTGGELKYAVLNGGFRAAVK